MNKMIETGKVKEILEGILAGGPIFLVDLVIQQGNRIHVFIDGDRDVSISDCRELSVQIESMLSRDTEDFELMVSSAGIERPLKYSRQFRKNIGRVLSITPLEGVTLNGKLVRADENEIEIEHIILKPKKEKHRENTVLKYSEIKTAKVEVTFK